jgi:hypothetical protein
LAYGDGQFLFFLFRQNAKHFHADLAFLTRSYKLDLFATSLKHPNHSERFECGRCFGRPYLTLVPFPKNNCVLHTIDILPSFSLSMACGSNETGSISTDFPAAEERTATVFRVGTCCRVALVRRPACQPFAMWMNTHRGMIQRRAGFPD